MSISGGQTGRGPGDDDVFVVVRMNERDVAAVRRAIHASGPMVQDAVFRATPSTYNHGVDLYPALKDGMDRLFAGALEAKKNGRAPRPPWEAGR
jgi:hypothetical protein